MIFKIVTTYIIKEITQFKNNNLVIDWTIERVLRYRITNDIVKIEISYSKVIIVAKKKYQLKEVYNTLYSIFRTILNRNEQSES